MTSSDLIYQYKTTCNKLKKIQRVLIKRFGPSVSEVSEEFGTLANSFNEAFLPEYAAKCYIGQSKCEKLIGNDVGEVDALLRAARSFRAAHDKQERMRATNISHAYHEGAFRCYTQALSRLPDKSVIGAAIIRELKEINPNVELTSDFSSPCHRIWDLEQSAEGNLAARDYVAAFEKLSEIYDDVIERKCESLYQDVMKRIEVSRLLLLCLLQLPPSVRYDHKFIEKYSTIGEGTSQRESSPGQAKLPEDLVFLLQSLVVSCQAKDVESLISVRDELCQRQDLTQSQQTLLKEVVAKYSK
ncbi:40-kDa huntingtin-associated protein [Anopheles maculipalpis]|uniref:40-kDa huntingtin-associated protein n=1 Tax=Anopheles maculipalpis TaxID=1496333 RepID=UPI00215986F8|nr:40-kDa huntingtin-associated protein [Anopheles maculipalpis]